MGVGAVDSWSETEKYIQLTTTTDPQPDRHAKYRQVYQLYRDLYEANQDVYGLLRYGVHVKPGIGQHTETVWLIDWTNPEANHFAVAEEVTVAGSHTKRPDLVLFCVSTTGSGDFPGNFVPFARALDERSPSLVGVRYGLIAMGDSSYGDTFCGAGRRLDEMLEGLGATRLGERLEIDAMETFMADDAALPWVEEWIEDQQLQVA